MWFSSVTLISKVFLSSKRKINRTGKLKVERFFFLPRDSLLSLVKFNTENGREKT